MKKLERFMEFATVLKEGITGLPLLSLDQTVPSLCWSFADLEFCIS